MEKYPEFADPLDPFDYVVFWLVFGVMAVAGLLAICAVACAAPTPRGKPAGTLQAKNLAGRWQLSWEADARWRMTLADDGYYACWREGDGCTWTGIWDVKSGVLIITERKQLDGDTIPGPDAFTWRVRLARDKEGTWSGRTSGDDQRSNIAVEMRPQR